MRVKWEIVGLTLRGRLLDSSKIILALPTLACTAEAGSVAKRGQDSNNEPSADTQAEAPALSVLQTPVASSTLTCFLYQGGRVHCTGQ